MDAPPALVAPVPPVPQPGTYGQAFAYVSRGGVAWIRVGPGFLPECPADALPFRASPQETGLAPGLYRAYRLHGRNVLEPWSPGCANGVCGK
jgi:hypothetical protein